MTATGAALVTGAGRGLGQAIAVALAQAGRDVLLTARSETELLGTQELVAALGVRSWVAPADVTEPDDVARLRAFADSEVGPVDVIVNNAGNLVLKPFVALPGPSPAGMEVGLTHDEWQATMAVHVDGAFHVLQSFGPDLLRRRHGRVVNIVSSALGRGVPFSVGYDTAKGALAQLTRSLAFEWAPYGVTVNAIAVGQVRTSMTASAHDDPRTAAWLLRRIPMGRRGEASEVGRFVTKLVDDDAGFLTGQIIALDGGETL